MVLTVLLRYRLVITFRRRGIALLLGLTCGALLIGGMATAAPVGVLPTGVQQALGTESVPLPTAAPASRAPSAPAPAAAPARSTIPLAGVPVVPVPSATATPTPTPTPDPTPEPDAEQESRPDPEPASRPAVALAGPTSGGPTAAVVALTNDARADAGCDPLSVDSRMTAAAQAHSADMAENDYFAHDSEDGRDFADRIRAEGYPSPGAENIAQGQRSASEVVTAWMNSPGHRRNIEDCSLNTIGVGLAGGDFYWTQDFGR